MITYSYKLNRYQKRLLETGKIGKNITQFDIVPTFPTYPQNIEYICNNKIMQTFIVSVKNSVKNRVQEACQSRWTMIKEQTYAMHMT